MKSHFQKLLDYNSWVNSRFLDCLQQNTVVNNKIYLLFSHVLTAEEIWLCRVKGELAPNQRLWQVYDDDHLPQMLEENKLQWQVYLQACSDNDLFRSVNYQNTKGESFSNQLCDIITHLVNHGSHHRGQIASMLQQEKVLPPQSDYIVYAREQNSAIPMV